MLTLINEEVTIWRHGVHANRMVGWNLAYARQMIHQKLLHLFSFSRIKVAVNLKRIIYNFTAAMSGYLESPPITGRKSIKMLTKANVLTSKENVSTSKENVFIFQENVLISK